MTLLAYKGYCYPDLTSVSIAYRSDIIANGNNVLSIPDFFDRPTFNDTVIYYSSQIFDSYNTSLLSSDGQLIQKYPICDFIGPLTTQTGLSIDDAMALTAAIIVVWVIAWSLRILRKTL